LNPGLHSCEGRKCSTTKLQAEPFPELKPKDAHFKNNDQKELVHDKFMKVHPDAEF
jgi:hypothetical protein